MRRICYPVRHGRRDSSPTSPVHSCRAPTSSGGTAQNTFCPSHGTCRPTQAGASTRLARRSRPSMVMLVADGTSRSRAARLDTAARDRDLNTASRSGSPGLAGRRSGTGPGPASRKVNITDGMSSTGRPRGESPEVDRTVLTTSCRPVASWYSIWTAHGSWFTSSNVNRGVAAGARTTATGPGKRRSAIARPSSAPPSTCILRSLPRLRPRPGSHSRHPLPSRGQARRTMPR